MGLVRGLGVACLVASATACTTSATVTRSNGTSVEGWIRGGTVDTVLVEPRIGQRQEIPRSEIAEIDHPGNVHVIVGGIVLGYGAVFVATSFGNCKDGSDPTSDCAALFLPALAGAGLLAWGLSTWLGSKEAADDRSLAHMPVRRSEPHDPSPPPVLPAPSDAPEPPAVLPPLGPRTPAPGPSASAAPPAEAPEVPAPAPPKPSPEPVPPPGVTW